MPDGEVSVEIRYAQVRSTPLGREIAGRCIAGAVVLAAAALIALRSGKRV